MRGRVVFPKNSPNFNVSHNQNLVPNWSAQNHANNSQGGCTHLWLALPNLHVPDVRISAHKLLGWATACSINSRFVLGKPPVWLGLNSKGHNMQAVATVWLRFGSPLIPGHVAIATNTNPPSQLPRAAYSHPTVLTNIPPTPKIRIF